VDLQEQERMVSDLEIQIDRLRALYEQYFMGIEKLEPHVPRKQVERLLQTIRRQRLNNTAQRFRFQQLVQRYNTMQTYWRRVARQIEEGTYRRDVMRARARAEEHLNEVRKRMRGDKEEKEEIPSHDVDLDDFEDTSPGAVLPEAVGQHMITSPSISERPPIPRPQQSMQELLNDPTLATGANVAPQSPRRLPPVPPPSPPTRGQRPPPPPPPPQRTARQDLAPERIQAIYRDYVSARQRCNQSTVGLTFDKVSQQIRTQENALRQKHGKEVDFQVTIREGKAILRAVRKG
jgi:hypothetical protein